MGCHTTERDRDLQDVLQLRVGTTRMQNPARCEPHHRPRDGCGRLQGVCEGSTVAQKIDQTNAAETPHFFFKVGLRNLRFFVSGVYNSYILLLMAENKWVNWGEKKPTYNRPHNSTKNNLVELWCKRAHLVGHFLVI